MNYLGNDILFSSNVRYRGCNIVYDVHVCYDEYSVLSRSLMVDFILFSLFALFYFSFLFSFLIFYF